ncbi:MAG: type II toxin-antitoxin system YhaV family toxin [Candidatus Omnitrophota bacterium]
MSNYVLQAHQFFSDKVDVLKERVKGLKKSLPPDEYLQNEIVKFAARVRKATLKTIPEDPNRRDYLLAGDLKKFRRFKQGLQRYRIIFCFSNKPGLILYLYLNDEKHLRKDGNKNDSYNEFKSLLNKGEFSHDPQDPRIKQWINEYS